MSGWHNANGYRPRCVVAGCTKAQHTGEHCVGHAARIKRHGDPLAHVPLADRANPMERAEMIWRKFRRSDTGCWEWTGATNDSGYGVVNGTGAHRAVYQLLVGEIPKGYVLDHLCSNRRCVNPAHLEAVTVAENNRRALASRPKPTHCKRGHEFTPENTVGWSTTGGRGCRICQNRMARLRMRLRRRQQREERQAALAAKYGEQLELWEMA